MKKNIYGAKIVAMGSAVPEKVIKNFDLERIVDTSDDWIRSRTGIFERRVVSSSEAVSHLAIIAAQKALQKANFKPSAVELIITATCTPDMLFPATSCIIADRLNIKNAAGFDLSAACSGFIFALSTAHQYISSGMYKNALVIGADVLSKFINWHDRNTCILFGDAAGAVVLARAKKSEGILASYMKIEGSGTDLLKIPAGGSAQPLNMPEMDLNLGFITMQGKEVFKFAVAALEKSVRKALKMCKLKVSDIDLFIPHQANIRIIDHAISKLGLSKNKVYVNLHKYGNTSAASIPLALDEAFREKKIKRGDILVVSGFGAGLTYGASVMRW